LTLTETQVAGSMPISAEDGRHGAFVLVSVLSLLSGVAPVTFSTLVPAFQFKKFR